MTRIIGLLLLVLILTGCASAATQAGGVAIYLPRQPMSGAEILAADVSKLALQAQPIIAAQEILSYSASSHELEVKPEAVRRLAGLKVPVQGMGFVVCVGESPLFAGAFWTPLSSLSFDGLTINVPFGEQETRLRLYSGYPMLDAPFPNDPREDARLLDAFRQAGKLR